MNSVTKPCTTTVYLVRHAEKAGGDNPDLTPQGHARAAALARLLKDASLVAVYSTDTRRTRATALPTAEAKQLPVSLYDARQSEETLRARLTEHRCQTLLVVGHSNTLPALMRATGAEPIGELNEAQYGDLYVVRLTDGAITREARRFEP